MADSDRPAGEARPTSPALLAPKGVCIFCKTLVGFRKRTRLLLKHPIWVSGYFVACPGTGCYSTPIHVEVAHD